MFTIFNWGGKKITTKPLLHLFDKEREQTGSIFIKK